MKFGIALGRVHWSRHTELTLLADALAYESVWLPEHLVLPVDMGGSPFSGEEHPPIPVDAPILDCFGYLSYLAALTERIRLGTHVYLLGLRHPFVAARAVQTLDVVSGGRAEIGVGAGWLTEEWRVAGFDPRTRGHRLDEAIAVCRRLWHEPVVEHHGEFFDFDPVMFEPKPIQQPGPPIHIGGESPAALRRAAALGDGWVGMAHTPESVLAPIARIRGLLRDGERSDAGFEFACFVPTVEAADIERFADAGVTRLIVAPWTRSSDALDGARRFAETHLS
ncbi:MAG: TIGR03619 family F420-dependent LLM class oxidoreductase [Acidimicrobiia bacterium]|nr:TIGR03619 family F420-dependent LLM class oxidoreductase [Acidimicrobiia bacterium]